MTRRRLATCALALAVLPLSACGEGNPVGDFVQGPQQTGQTSPPTTTEADTTTPATTPPQGTGTETPGAGMGTDTNTMGTDTMGTNTMGTGTMGTATTGTAGTPTAGVGTATGTQTTTVTSTASPTAGTAAPGSAPQTAVAQVDGRTIQGVPTGMGFPAEAGIEATSAFASGGGSVVMSEPTEADIFAYYRSALPGAGFRIVSDTSGTLAFTGHGFRGTLVGTGSGGVLTWSPVQD